MIAWDFSKRFVIFGILRIINILLLGAILISFTQEVAMFLERMYLGQKKDGEQHYTHL